MATMFEIYSKKTKRNNTGDVTKNKMFQIYSVFNYMVERLSIILAKKTNETSRYIHYYFRNEANHIVSIRSEAKLGKIIESSPGCKKGQYIPCRDFESCEYERKDVLRRFHNEIKRADIDMNGFRKIWPSHLKSMNWLV